MGIFNTVISNSVRRQYTRVEHFNLFPEETQITLLKNLIQNSSNTEWGAKYSYSTIKDYPTYRNRVPIQDYESLAPFILRMRKGEQNILWPTLIKWFAKSSGTTNDKSKFIPISNESLKKCHFDCGKALLAIYCTLYPDTKIFNGKSLGMGGSLHEYDEYKYSYYGDLSAVLMKNLPMWIELIRTPPLEVALMDKWEEKLIKLASITSQQNVTNIAGVPSWTLLLLKRIIELTGKSNILEVWPEFEVFFHGGVSFNPYKEQYAKILNSNSVNYLETYNASEGFFGIQDQKNSKEMLLLLDYGVFYEFIPFSEICNENPAALCISEVEKDVNYAIVISTNAGLWRYMIGDTIKFTSLKPYRFKITGRTKNFINAFGEEIIIDNAEKALTSACQKTNAVIKEYTAAPIYFTDNECGSHEWLIEFEKSPENIDDFTDELDKALKALNSDYEAKRYNDMALRKPIVRMLKADTFYNWMKSRGKLGGQHKVPRLSNDRKLVEEILNL